MCARYSFVCEVLWSINKTIQVRIQVIDIKPQVLDLRVPVYLKASDLSQRIIRDAGLEPFWPNRKRKLYWLRARGRLLQDHETLQNLGVIDNELIYILPQPLPEMGVVEQSPDYPKVNDYLGQGLPLLIFMLFAIMMWSFCWGITINASQHWLVSILPSMGVSVLCISFSRHAWGGSPSHPRVGGTAFFLYTLSVLFASFDTTGSQRDDASRVYCFCCSWICFGCCRFARSDGWLGGVLLSHYQNTVKYKKKTKHKSISVQFANKPFQMMY